MMLNSLSVIIVFGLVRASHRMLPKILVNFDAKFKHGKHYYMYISICDHDKKVNFFLEGRCFIMVTLNHYSFTGCRLNWVSIFYCL